MARAPRPDDLYGLRVPTEVALSPDASQVVFTVKSVAPGKDDYRESLWIVPADGSAPPRQLTLGAKNDTVPRWSPDGRSIAFLSDRGVVLARGGAPSRPMEKSEEQDPPKEGSVQVWLLPMGGGEARCLTDLPQDVSDIRWSPDGRTLCLVSGAQQAEREGDRRKPGDPPKRDARLIDRLQYMLNGVGFIYDKVPNLWLLDVESGDLRRLTGGKSRDEEPAWSPDGRRIAFKSNRHPDADLSWRTDIYVVDVEGGGVTRVTGGRGERAFALPMWSPDGEWIAAIGHRFPAGGASRSDVWRFRPEREQEGENLSAESDRDADAAMNSDLFGFAPARAFWTADGAQLVFSAPIDGSYELWLVDAETRQVTRATTGEHYISRPDLVALADGGVRVAAIRGSGSEPPDVVAIDLPRGAGGDGVAPDVRRLSRLASETWADVRPVVPVERWHECDGRRIQGWFLEAERKDGRPAPLVVEIHGGPATLYGWSLMWEWQSFVAAGMSVYACNPRGSQGYGQAFTHANYRDWGEGPMRDVMGGIDALIADGLVDPDRLGVTGGSYGGYLTSWIVGHTDRFKAAITCRSVNDMTSEMLSGDIAGPQFGKLEYGANPWEDPELYRRHSPLTYADRIHTPLLIQHAEDDLRCTITQAEELFTVLRSLRRPVRLMRVPDESHDLTRGGKPFRRVENIERLREWFVHFLVDEKPGLPPA